MDSVNDILQQYLKPQIKAIGNRARKESIKIANDNIDHGLAERGISGKSNILIIPNDNEEKYKYEENEDNDNLKNVKNKPNVNVRFLTVSGGRTGNIFDARLEGKTTIIEWNIDHPFYEKFVLSNKDNTELVTAVDYLIYSIATSQLKVFADDDRKVEIIDQLISVMSNNMRALLE